MFLNLLLMHYDLNYKNNKIFNKIMIISFILYWIMYIFFGNFLILLATFDSIYFIKKYILLKSPKSTNIQKYSNKNKDKDFIPLLNKFTNIDKNNTLIKKIIIDPEYESDKYKPYKYDLKEALVQVSNNLL